MAHTVTCYEWDRIEGLEEEQRVALEAWTDKYNKNTSGDEDADTIIIVLDIDYNTKLCSV